MSDTFKCGQCKSEIPVGYFHSCPAKAEKQLEEARTDIERLRTKLGNSQTRAGKLAFAIRQFKEAKGRHNTEIAVKNMLSLLEEIDEQNKLRK